MNENMRAAVMYRRGPSDVLTLVENHPRPAVRKPDDVLVQIHAASINPVDTYMRAGTLPVPFRYPKILGGDACGVVVEVGAAVHRFRPGDRVYGMLDYLRRQGCYAEYALFRDRELALAPRELSDVEAAAIPLVGLTVYQALVGKAGLTSGQRVLVHGGSGGIGTFAIPFIKHRGSEVIVTCSAASADLCRSLGADGIVDYAKPDCFADPTLGTFDIILDAVGGYFPRTIGLLRQGGTFVTITVLSDTGSYTLGNYAQHLRRLAWSRIKEMADGPRVRMAGVRPSGEQLDEIRAFVEQSGFRPPIAQTFPLAEVARAHDLVEQHRTRGKIALAIRTGA